MKFKYVLVYYLKNGCYGIQYYTSKKQADKNLSFYLHNSNYALVKVYKKSK